MKLKKLKTIAKGTVGLVIQVYDGDTLKVKINDVYYIIRLYGIDAPEEAQDFGQKAKDYLFNYVCGLEIEIESLITDKYGRFCVLIELDGKIINHELVKAGLAWVSNWLCQKNSYSEAWMKSQAVAKKQKIGLWANLNCRPPWYYRKTSSGLIGRPIGSQNKFCPFEPIKKKIDEYSMLGLTMASILKLINPELENPVSYQQLKYYMKNIKKRGVV